MVGVKFYHYNDEIIKKLKKRGAQVTFHYERDISIRHALIDTFFGAYMESWQKRHYDGILQEIRNKKFDFLLVIRGYKMPVDFVEKVKALNPGLKTIMYQWDSLNNSDYLESMKGFDKTCTFDYKDAGQLDISYVPTFHTDEFSSLPTVPIQYDMFYYGNYTTLRYQHVAQIQSFADAHGYRLKTHIFLSYKRYITERIKGVKIDQKYVTFKRMNKAEYIHSFNASNIIIDITTQSQSGLAMRVLDTLGAGKKLITNNSYIDREPYFDPKQIYIVDPDNFDVPPEFFKVELFQKVNYSIDAWIDGIFS